MAEVRLPNWAGVAPWSSNKLFQDGPVRIIVKVFTDPLTYSGERQINDPEMCLCCGLLPYNDSETRVDSSINHFHCLNLLINDLNVINTIITYASIVIRLKVYIWFK